MKEVTTDASRSDADIFVEARGERSITLPTCRQPTTTSDADRRACSTHHFVSLRFEHTDGLARADGRATTMRAVLLVPARRMDRRSRRSA